MKRFRACRILAVCGAAAVCIGASPAASADDGSAGGWSITPYLWATDTTVGLTFRDANIGTGRLSFDDLLDVLDQAFMVYVEGGKDRWSAFGDLTYLETSDTDERAILTIDSRSKQVLLDAAISYRPGGGESPFSIFGGLRYAGFDDRYTFSAGGQQLGQQRSNDKYYDVLLGVRYRFELSDRWNLLTRADASFGDSEGTYLVRANFGYTVGKRGANQILFGYQYKQAEFRSGDLRTKFDYKGPMAGFSFRF
jgi:hypothetical protein